MPRFRAIETLTASRRTALWALLAATLVVGCQTGPRMVGLNPFYRPERTTLQTPPQRLLAIRALAEQADGSDSPEQQQLVSQLVEQLQDEPDPLIRQALLESVAAFSTPLAGRAVKAGLQDTDTHVRHACCELLASKPVPEAAEALAALARSDEDFDVRVAATAALGKQANSTDQLVALLRDRDPAMQLTAVEAMRQMTGQDLGNDVPAYIALAQRGAAAPATPTAPAETRVAKRRLGWLPFF